MSFSQYSARWEKSGTNVVKVLIIMVKQEGTYTGEGVISFKKMKLERRTFNIYKKKYHLSVIHLLIFLGA
ncbi:hypothetical protein JCM15908A_14230 [Prevotella dentasini JCM 15908]